MTAHGTRSTFRDWVGEKTNFQREVAEACLAHVLDNKSEAAYQRGDYLEKRRIVMQAWANFCSTSRPLTLPSFRVALSPTITRPFFAVPRTSVARTASG